MATRKMTRAERQEFEAEYARVMANALRTRELAERGQAKLEGRPPREVGQPDTATMLADAQRLRELAEQAQAKLDAQNARG
jgi:hypothetical protein